MNPLLWLLMGMAVACSVLSLTISWFSYIQPARQRQDWERHSTWLLSAAVVFCLLLLGALMQEATR